MVVSSTGMAGTIGFLILVVMWLVTMTKAIIHVKHGRIDEHRRWMLRNYPLTMGAVWFRMTPLLFQVITGVPDAVAYLCGAYIALGLAIALGELYVFRYHSRSA